MNIKSERLKKLESELQEMELWLKLGLPPKKEIEKHKNEIALLKEKITEEKERLRFLKDSGAMEEYTPPKRANHQRQAFPDTASMPDIDMAEENVTDAGFEIETDYDSETQAEDETDAHTSGGEEDEDRDEPEEEEDSFFGNARWERVVDPDKDE